MTQDGLKTIVLTNYDYSIEAENTTNKGLFIALIIIALWAISLILLLSLNTSKIQISLIVLAILWQTFLYTGLFITAHDSMHGVVYTKNLKINNLIGKIAAILYALFSYKNLARKHWLHHRYPGTEVDPDFDNNQQQNIFVWYFKFMKAYWDWRQFFGLVIIFNILKFFLKLPEINIDLFWIIPAILSSIQLFYFGTFLPHKKLEGGYTNLHCTQSVPLPIFWSFITCYHFGYHQEHHEYPSVPWWKLPDVYKNRWLNSKEKTEFDLIQARN